MSAFGIAKSHTTHRSEVVGRPLAALLANDGARVFSVDINDIQVLPLRVHLPL
jgi:5,10-methylene-tetrahydrofolate dehydrogenase/methenyl tetrahydrofolate cyclohydrolase